MAEIGLTLPMQRFIADVRTIVRDGGGERAVTEKVATRLRHYCKSPTS